MTMSSTQKVTDFLAQLTFSKDLEKSSKEDGEQELPGLNQYKTPSEYTIEKLCGQYRAVENEARKIIRDHQKSIMEKKDNLNLYSSKLPNLESKNMTVRTKIDSWAIQNKTKYQEAFLEKKKYAREAPVQTPHIKARAKPQGTASFLVIAAVVCLLEAFANVFALQRGMEPIDAFMLSLLFSVLVIVPTVVFGRFHKKARDPWMKGLYLLSAVIWSAYINLLIALVRTDINKILKAEKLIVRLDEINLPWSKAIHPVSFFEIQGIEPFLLIFFGLGSACIMWYKIQNEVQTHSEEMMDYADSHAQRFKSLEKEIKEAFSKILMDEEPKLKQCGEEISVYMEDIRASKQLISNELDNLKYLIEGTRSNFKLMISECRNINMIHRKTKPPEHWATSNIEDAWIKLDEASIIEVDMRALVNIADDLNQKIVQLEIEWSQKKNAHNKNLDETLKQWAEEANIKY